MDIATAFRTAMQHRQTRRALKDESCRRNARLPYPTASRQKQNPDPARTMRSPLATPQVHHGGSCMGTAQAVTPLIHTFDGVSIQCMVGQCRHTLSLPEVFFEARGKVMEMVEHSPSQGKPAKLPIICYERPVSRLGAWLAYGAVWWEWAVRSGGLQ